VTLSSFNKGQLYSCIEELFIPTSADLKTGENKLWSHSLKLFSGKQIFFCLAVWLDPQNTLNCRLTL